MKTKTALVTGATGQDGSFLMELLLSRGYTVYGLARRLSHPTFDNIKHLLDSINLIDGDLGDYISIVNAVKRCEPDEIYNLGAQSFVATSWQQAEYTSNITGIGALRVFEAAKQVGDYLGKQIKIYQASSSEMYGNQPAPQNEESQMTPRSPYGVAKLFAHRMARVYRESYNMQISCGILYNHESPRRGIEFVSRKISDGVARIHLGIGHKLKLGNINAKRDWGYSSDYVQAIWMMLQQEKSDDFVIASGENHSVKEFVELAFNHVGLDWKDYVVVDKCLIRPAEIDELLGDHSKAEKVLGWKPKTSFKELVEMMVNSDIEKLKATDSNSIVLKS